MEEEKENRQISIEKETRLIQPDIVGIIVSIIMVLVCIVIAVIYSFIRL